ncbi:sulfatase-like protein [Jejuia pallidilutea]|uniref:Sulfatase-like protein n=1 Tax=Jejuia pallidilutea TaxID=504487 RepID=A0A362X428_9FLAO|nr:sulfatase-like protein [Jejuia pallidilutea]
MAVGFLKPHVPWHVPQKWFDMYPLDSIVLPPYLSEDMDDIPRIAKDSIDHLPMMPTTEWALKTNNWKKIMQAYLACVSFVDSQIGVVLETLENGPHAEKTIVVLWSDHGYRIGEKGTFAKQCLWEEATRSPLIFSGPGIPKNKKIEAPTELLSIYPTMLDLCGLPENKENEGLNLAPIIKGNVASNNSYAITTYGWGNHSIRSGSYRYTQYEDGSEELYDEIEDPNEFDNLANKPERSNIKDSLRKLLPKVNTPWHKFSSYGKAPYFQAQKKRIRAEVEKVDE